MLGASCAAVSWLLVSALAMCMMTGMIVELRKLVPAPSWTIVLRIWEELCSHQHDELSGTAIPPYLAGEKEKAAKLIAAEDRPIGPVEAGGEASPSKRARGKDAA